MTADKPNFGELLVKTIRALFRPEGPVQLSAPGNAWDMRSSHLFALKMQRSSRPRIAKQGNCTALTGRKQRGTLTLGVAQG